MKIQSFDQLTTKIYPTRTEMGRAAAQEAVAVMGEMLEGKSELNVIFAAAPSQNELLAALCTADLDWSRINAFHMDEYLGLPTDAPQCFGQFLNRAIFEKLPFKQVFLIHPQGAPEEICRGYQRLLRDYPVDVVFMGIGENGHIAFNDPPFAKFDDTALVKTVVLEERCRQQQVNDGCFPSIEQVPTTALTVTIPALLSAQHIFCVVPGETKAEAVSACLTGEITENWPASILRTKNNAILYLDSDSAKLL